MTNHNSYILDLLAFLYIIFIGYTIIGCVSIIVIAISLVAQDAQPLILVTFTKFKTKGPFACLVES
jgi:uncharacterized membrane protein